MIEQFRQPVLGLAASFDYRHSEEDFSNLVPNADPNLRASFASQSSLDSYTLRPEIVPFSWLSVYGIGARYDGNNTLTSGPLIGRKASLDGWGAGVGTTLALGLPRWLPESVPGVAVDPLFILPDFNWTRNDFDGIANDVDVINVTTRIGFGARDRIFNGGIYGGPTYQSVTRDLLFSGFGPSPVLVQSSLKDSWSGVIGAFFGIRLSSDPKLEQRPTLLATVEGGVGNRQGVLITLRYEYDFLQSPPDQSS